MRGWEGSRKGPCTVGEAKTMTAIMCGAEPDEVEAFIVIATVKCENCGHPHNSVTNVNVPAEEAIELLVGTISRFIQELNNG